MDSIELRAAREASGLSQQGLARLAGVSRSTIAFSERGMMLGEGSRLKVEAALREALAKQSRAVAKAKRRVNKATAESAQTAAA